MPKLNLTKLLSLNSKLFLTFAALSLLVFLGICLSFSVDNFHYAPQADDYRLTLYHLKPFFDGTWEPKLLWGDVHPNPVHGGFLILSAIYEHMSFSSLPYIAFFFLVLKWLLLSNAFYTAAGNSVSMKLKLYAIIWMGFIFFGFSTPQQYIWNSVAIANIYHAISALFLILLIRPLNGATSVRLVLLLAIAFSFLIISRQYAVPWVYAACITLALASIADRANFTRIYLKIFSVLVLSLVLEGLFYWAMDINITYKSTFGELASAINENWSGRLGELIKFSLVEMSLPLIYPQWLINNEHFNPIYVKAGVYISSFILIYAALIATLNIKHNKGYLLSVMAIGFTAITILGTIAFRTEANTDWLMSHIPRYTAFRNISIVAVVWILLISLQKSFLTKIVHPIFLGWILVVFSYTQYSYVETSLSITKSRLIGHKRVSQQLQFTYNQISTDKEVSPAEIKKRYEKKFNTPFSLVLGTADENNHNWRFEVISIWGDNKLNLFRDMNTEKAETQPAI